MNRRCNLRSRMSRRRRSASATRSPRCIATRAWPFAKPSTRRGAGCRTSMGKNAPTSNDQLLRESSRFDDGVAKIPAACAGCGSDSGVIHGRNAWHGYCRLVSERRRPMRCLTALAALCLAIVPTLAQAQEPANTPPAAQASVTTTEQTGFFTEPAIIGKTIRSGNRWLGVDDGGEISNGFYADIGGMITGAGWISGGPGYRHWLLGDQVLVDASAQLSWRMYKLVQARIEAPKLAGPHLAAGVEARWQDLTQVSYFGPGPDSVETNRSEYRVEYANVAGYLTAKPAPWLAV